MKDLNITFDFVSADELYSRLGKQFRNSRIAFRLNDGCKYIAAFDENKLVGCVGFQRIGETMRYKIDFVLPEYRKKGIYTKLWELREIQNKCSETSAFCTEFSLGMFLKNKFEIHNVKKNGISFVKRW
ncbi:MAG: GNAT family N-acetyltransferase [Bacteroidales bacterium]|jgi:hypothetical protein|nr:GNAT family N-acetyltransferase [Bacteroidales bacterium]